MRRGGNQPSQFHRYSRSGTLCTGGESVNPYNPSTAESTLISQYVSFGLTYRLGRTEMEGMQQHGNKTSHKAK